MVEVGVAVTDAPVPALNVAVGVQEYMVAPLAVSAMLPPAQTAALAGATVIAGSGFTMTEGVEEDAVQPAAFATVTV